jgi:hypothetical protein
MPTSTGNVQIITGVGGIDGCGVGGRGGGRRGAAWMGGGGRRGVAAGRATAVEDRGVQRQRAALGNVGRGRRGGVDVWEWRWLLWRRRWRRGVEYCMLCEEEESSMSVISTNSHTVMHKFCLLCVCSQFLRFASIQKGGREPKHS